MYLLFNGFSCKWVAEKKVNIVDGSIKDLDKISGVVFANIPKFGLGVYEGKLQTILGRLDISSFRTSGKRFLDIANEYFADERTFRWREKEEYRLNYENGREADSRSNRW